MAIFNSKLLVYQRVYQVPEGTVPIIYIYMAYIYMVYIYIWYMYNYIYIYMHGMSSDLEAIRRKHCSSLTGTTPCCPPAGCATIRGDTWWIPKTSGFQY